MIELTDNLIQFAATAIGCIWAGVSFAKSRKQPLFLLACFYGVYALGTLYWALRLLLFGETPPLFYVSEIVWIASYTFFLTLLITMRSPAQKQHKTALCWLAPVFCVPQFFCIFHTAIFFTIC